MYGLTSTTARVPFLDWFDVIARDRARAPGAGIAKLQAANRGCNPCAGHEGVNPTSGLPECSESADNATLK